MRKFAAAALVLVLVLAFTLWSRRESNRTALSPSPAQREEQRIAEEDLAELNLEGPEKREDAVRPASPIPAESNEPTGAGLKPTCVVLGTVTDASGAPLAEVRVLLQAYKVWTDGVEVPRLKTERPLVGFEASTDATGAFRFEAPVPTNNVTWLDVSPTRFYDSHRITFNSDSARYQPSLTEGVRDLGQIRLATTGAIHGRVLSSSGAPLAGVRLDVGPDRSTTYSRRATSGPDGSYILGHAPIGTYCIKAKLEGYLSGLIEPVTVEAQRDTGPVDFVLEVAPSIEGRVTDETGKTLEGARLWGWPESSGSGAGARSGPDGRFTVFLPQDEPYSLECKLAGHEKWGGDRDVTYSPGTTGIEIVMTSVPLTRFIVLDAETLAPLKEFGINILLDNGSLSPNRSYTERRRPKSKPRENGSAEVTARTGSDLYVIAAPDYGMKTGDVKHDSPGVPVQTVQLAKGASVTGRLLRAGQPVEGATVTMVKGEQRIDENTQVTTKTGADGRFKLGGMTSGKFRFTATSGKSAPLQLQGIALFLGKAKDLGDLELPEHAATIDGEVLLPIGVEPAGLEVALGAWQDKNRALVDERGKFRFENLPAGTHTLRLVGRPGILAHGPTVKVRCEVGETRSVTMDARDRGLCAVTLQFDLGGLPTEGYIVEVANAADPMEDARLGRCDADGRVSGHARGWGESIVQLWLPDGRTLDIEGTGLELRSGEEIEMVVRRQFARLHVALPAGTVLPSKAEIMLDLERTDSVEGGAILQFETKRDGLVDSSAWAGTDAKGIFVDGLPSGPHHITFELTRDDDASDGVTPDVGPGRSGDELEMPYRGEADASLIDGEEVSIELN